MVVLRIANGFQDTMESNLVKRKRDYLRNLGPWGRNSWGTSGHQEEEVNLPEINYKCL